MAKKKQEQTAAMVEHAGVQKWELQKEVPLRGLELTIPKEQQDVGVATRAAKVAVIAEYGAEIIRSLVHQSDKYYQMAQYIRLHEVDADVVRDALEPLGFIKQRITEISYPVIIREQLERGVITQEEFTLMTSYHLIVAAVGDITQQALDELSTSPGQHQEDQQS